MHVWPRIRCLLHAKAVVLAAIIASVAVAVALSDEAPLDSPLRLVDRYGIPIVSLVFVAWLLTYRIGPWLSLQFQEGKEYLFKQIDDAKREREQIQGEFLKALDERNRHDAERTKEILAHVTQEVGAMTVRIVEKIDTKSSRGG